MAILGVQLWIQVLLMTRVRKCLAKWGYTSKARAWHAAGIVFLQTYLLSASQRFELLFCCALAFFSPVFMGPPQPADVGGFQIRLEFWARYHKGPVSQPRNQAKQHCKPAHHPTPPHSTPPHPTPPGPAGPGGVRGPGRGRHLEPPGVHGTHLPAAGGRIGGDGRAAGDSGPPFFLVVSQWSLLNSSAGDSGFHPLSSCLRKG